MFSFFFLLPCSIVIINLMSFRLRSGVLAGVTTYTNHAFTICLCMFIIYKENLYVENICCLK